MKKVFCDFCGNEIGDDCENYTDWVKLLMQKVQGKVIIGNCLLHQRSWDMCGRCTKRVAYWLMALRTLMRKDLEPVALINAVRKQMLEALDVVDFDAEVFIRQKV